MEYQIQLQLGPQGYLHGQESLSKLFSDYPQARDLIETKLHQATDVMSFLSEFKEIIVRWGGLLFDCNTLKFFNRKP